MSLKRKLRRWGTRFFENKYEVRILDNGACKLIIIDKTDTHVIDPNNVSYITLSHKDKTELLDLACELAKTPLADREEEKRYWLLSVSPMLRKNECGYLLYHERMGRYFTGAAEYGGDVYQAIFTESEIAEMDITGFEKVEVNE